MSTEGEPNQRKSRRLQGHNYAGTETYFVTLCTHQRQCLFGKISAGSMQASSAGLMVRELWEALPNRFPFIELDGFVVMPNHFHGLLLLEGQMQNAGRIQGLPQQNPVPEHSHPAGTGEGTLGRVIQAFKSETTHQYTIGVKKNGWPAFDSRIWQRDYYDHVVRDEAALENIRNYIDANPNNWEGDQENPDSIVSSARPPSW